MTYGALMDALSRRVMELTKASVHEKRSVAVGESAIGSAPIGDEGKAGSASEEVDGGAVAATLRRCFDLREEMDDAGVAPDGTTINTILSACGRAAEVRALSADALQKAFDLYDEMNSSDEADGARRVHVLGADQGVHQRGSIREGLLAVRPRDDPGSGHRALDHGLPGGDDCVLAPRRSRQGLGDLGGYAGRASGAGCDALRHPHRGRRQGRSARRRSASSSRWSARGSRPPPRCTRVARRHRRESRGRSRGVESAIAEVASRGLAVRWRCTTPS